LLLLVFAKRPAKLRKEIPEVLENADENLTPRMRNLLALLSVLPASCQPTLSARETAVSPAQVAV